MRNISFDWKKTIYTDGSSNFIRYSDNELRMNLRVHKNDEIEAVFLRTIPDGEQELRRMKKREGNGFFDYYTTKINIKKNLTNYRFLILTSNDMYWYSQKGLSRVNPPDNTDFKFIRDFRIPKWLEKSVFYQIFPDRFCDGNSFTNVRDGEYIYEGNTTRACPWGNEPGNYRSGKHLDFFGGDLSGIGMKIPYLKKLGINALYLNPVFLSPSNHKYDTQDYRRIDPHFGTNKEFAKLVKKLHDSGIRIILDGVFNHVGMSHFWFNKAGFYPENVGAYNNITSPYREYFTFYPQTDDYHCWNGVKTLPKLNYTSENLRKEIYKSFDSIMNFWLSPPYGIDGWRLDVANMIARQGDYQTYAEVYREMREWNKSTKRESFLMGEHFFDPSCLLQGDMLDSAMNYQGFLFPVIRWITGKERFKIKGKKDFINIQFTSRDLGESLRSYLSLMPFDISLLMFNLLDCHDLPRFYSLVNEKFSLLRLGVVLLFTYPGVPCIYYGDETGMTGIKEPQVRRCMNWDEKFWNTDIMELYRGLIKLRKTLPALKKGGFKIIYEEEEIFSYARFWGDSILFVILNNNSQEKEFLLPSWQIGEIEGKLRDFFSTDLYEIEEGYLKINLPPYGAVILIKE